MVYTCRMTVAPLREKALVLYKTSPALVLKPGDKIEIALGSGETVRVRPKDIELIHPGPCESLGGLGRLEGDTSDAWELLQGQTSTLKELAELVYGAYTPATAWSAWLVVAEGLYFQGTPAGVQARPPGEVEAERGTREKAAAEARAWGEFLERAKQGKAMAEDRRFTADVEAVALGKSQKSRLMRELGTQVTAENAHALLLRLGHWTPSENPYPRRYDMPLTAPRVELPPIAEEQRRDLTHLEAYAIDDEGNQDPDDALSYDGQRIWIHVADVAALVAPDSPADVEARGVGANLYLPERIVPMLPPEATLALGLGLQPISPALSFGLVIGPDGGIEDIEITPSRVKVTRLTYEEADTRLSEGIFPQLLDITGRFKARRRRLNPVTIDYPEVKIRVVDGRVVIRPLVRLRSRELVTEAMLMAGEAAARFALKHHIAFPFTTQPAPEGGDAPQDLAAMFAFRKKLKPSVNKASAEPHFGLGLEAYARATSPLRRYLDLVVHQQLRGFLTGGRQLGVAEMLERVGAAEAVLGSVKRVERLSNLHWTLVYLLQNPDWTGKGIVLDRQKQQAVVVIPALGMETRVYAPGNAALNSELELRSPKVDLAFLSAHFQVR